MTTNQTIDGAPLLPCPFCGGEPYGTHDHYVHDDLSPMPCVECRSCSAHLKAEDWNRRVQPATQQKIEPVAWQIRTKTNRDDSTWTEWTQCGEMERALHSHEVGKFNRFGIMREIRPLYTEQPAPVGVVLPDRLQQVLKFLDGAENLDGHWFGEPHPSGRQYWWRNELRKALTETNLFTKQQ